MAEKTEDTTLRATLSMTTKGGYGVLLTIPTNTTDKEIEGMLTTINSADNLANLASMTAPVRSSGFAKKEAKPKDYTGQICPTCKEGKLYRMTTKTGKQLIKCSESTFINGIAGGCNYIKWVDDKPQQSAEERYY